VQGVSSGGPAQASLAPGGTKGRRLMSGMQWFWGTILAVLYLVFIFTVGLMTFRKATSYSASSCRSCGSSVPSCLTGAAA